MWVRKIIHYGHYQGGPPTFVSVILNLDDDKLTRQLLIKIEETNLIWVEETVPARGVYVSFCLIKCLGVKQLLETDRFPPWMSNRMSELIPPPLADSPRRMTMTRMRKNTTSMILNIRAVGEVLPL